MISHCKSCSAEIVWATTPGGKSMPLDAKHETLWLIEACAVGAPPTCRPVQVRRSHFATCPQADQHRRTTP